jgi:osmoprotectant transport system permease protein
VIIAGLRVAVVSSISLASVGQLIGVSSLGYFFIDGFQRAFPTEIYVGIALTIALALVSDLILVSVRALLTPWARGRTVAAGPVPAEPVTAGQV